MGKQPVRTLTIGGSDSGGAAGIQADLKTWTALGVYGMSVITAVTAQNSVSVQAVQYLEPDMVSAQIVAVLSDYGAQAVKTGFLGKEKLVRQVAWNLRDKSFGPLVVDPVLVNHRGESMFSPDVAEAYREHLLPLADLVTPNWREALLLAGTELDSGADEMALLQLGGALYGAGARQVLITGVPAGDNVIDFWFDGYQMRAFTQPKIVTENRHGSGDTLSAAICAYLAQGKEMGPAIEDARAFTRWALIESKDWRLGHGHGPLAHFPR